MRYWIRALLLTYLAANCVPLLLVGFLLVAAQQGKRQGYVAGLDAAGSTAPYVSDFVRLFPDAQIRYTCFTPGPEPGFDLTVILYERYELKMQLPVVFDSSHRAVVGYGEPTFSLVEAEKVEGRCVSYRSSGGRPFGSAEWRKIVANDGNFEAIGYAMKKDRPVVGLKALMSPVREGRR